MAIEWKNEPILDSVQLPGSETKYWVADKEAREMIETVVSATHFLGVTTTELTDGATTNPITINEESYTAEVGDIVIYTPSEGASLEFIWDGSKWQLLGGQTIEGLGDLAYKNSASGSYTPEGTIDLQSSEMDVVTRVSLYADVNLSFSTDSQGDESYEYFQPNVSQNVHYTVITGVSDYREINCVTDVQCDNHVVTNVSFNEYSAGVIAGFSNGELPSISNTSTITATMGTGASSTTLIFSLSDIGFSAGSFSEPQFVSVLVPSDGPLLDVTSEDISVRTNYVSAVYFDQYDYTAISTITTNVDFYYSIDDFSSLDLSTERITEVTGASFIGSASTITVS